MLLNKILYYGIWQCLFYFTLRDSKCRKLFLPLDINECTDGSADCAENADCENNEGSYDCTCKTGFSGNGKTCSGKGGFCIAI